MKDITDNFYYNLKIILDFLPDATFAIDKKGIVVAWNGAIEKMTGLKREDMLGRGNHEYALPFYGKRKPILINLVFKNSAELKKRYNNVQREKDILYGETELATVKGQRAYLRAKAGVIRNSRGHIIGAIESIRDITGLKRVEQTLRRSETILNEQKIALEQRNVDLKDILVQVESEKGRIQKNVVDNVETTLLPLIKKMRLKGESRKYLMLLQEGLENLVLSFGSRISDKRFHLSPREIEICNMIKNGMTGKEISRLLGLSFQTVQIHRKRIRRKLGISGEKINLTTFLKNLHT